eukprot:m.3714 g.3714  ORF g.3714 m.3714 type:complete len:444 (+) comp2345_c0_seq1:199-1530(+)
MPPFSACMLLLGTTLAVLLAAPARGYRPIFSLAELSDPAVAARCPDHTIAARSPEGNAVCLCPPYSSCQGDCETATWTNITGCRYQPLSGYPANCPTCSCTNVMRKLKPRRRPLPEQCDELLPGYCGPYIVIAGADKCGTNALAQYLELYPGLSTELPKRAKSLMCLERHWSGEVNWQWDEFPLSTSQRRERYASNFFPSNWDTSIAIDKSTSYFRVGTPTAQQIKATLPRARVAVVLCNPSRRVWSRMNQVNKFRTPNRDICPLMTTSWDRILYEQLLVVTAEMTSANYSDQRCFELLEKWIVPDSALLEHGVPERFVRSCVDICFTLKNGLFSELADQWLKVIGPEKLIVISNEELRKDPRLTMVRVIRQAGLSWDRYNYKNLGAVHATGSIFNRIDPALHHLVRIKDEGSPYYLKVKELLDKFYASELANLLVNHNVDLT